MNEQHEFQVILTSDSSLNIYKKNSLSDFANALPDAISFDLSEVWGVALSYIILPPVKRPVDFTLPAKLDGEVRSPLYVYLNIIEPQICGDNINKCIAVLPPPYEKSYHTNHNLIYFPLTRSEIRTISVTLRDKYFNKYPFEASLIPSVCCLRFKRLSTS